MKLFTNVKIGHRLAVGFGVILTLMGLIFITGMVYFDAFAS
jgi:hypothetical protein